MRTTEFGTETKSEKQKLATPFQLYFPVPPGLSAISLFDLLSIKFYRSHTY